MPSSGPATTLTNKFAESFVKLWNSNITSVSLGSVAGPWGRHDEPPKTTTIVSTSYESTGGAMPLVEQRGHLVGQQNRWID